MRRGSEAKLLCAPSRFGSSAARAFTFGGPAVTADQAARVKALAEARGWWESDIPPGVRRPWVFGHGRDGLIAIWHNGLRYDVDPFLAELVLRRAGREEVYAGPCGECDGSCVQHRTDAYTTPIDEEPGWRAGAREGHPQRSCPTCDATGKRRADLGVLVAETSVALRDLGIWDTAKDHSAASSASSTRSSSNATRMVDRSTLATSNSNADTRSRRGRTSTGKPSQSAVAVGSVARDLVYVLAASVGLDLGLSDLQRRRAIRGCNRCVHSWEGLAVRCRECEALTEPAGVEVLRDHLREQGIDPARGDAVDIDTLADAVTYLRTPALDGLEPLRLWVLDQAGRGLVCPECGGEGGGFHDRVTDGSHWTEEYDCTACDGHGTAWAAALRALSAPDRTEKTT